MARSSPPRPHLASIFASCLSALPLMVTAAGVVALGIMPIPKTTSSLSDVISALFQISTLMLAALAWRRAFTARRQTIREIERAERIMKDIRDLESGRGPVDPKVLEIVSVPELLWEVEAASGEDASSKPCVDRLLGSLHHDALDHHYGSREMLVWRYSDEAARGIDQLSASNRLVLQSGILGTFLGLVFSMGPLEDIYRGSVQSGDTVATLFDVLALSFSTSVTALLASISLLFQRGTLVKLHDQLTLKLHGLANALVRLMRHCQDSRSTARSFDQVTNRLVSVKERLDKQHAQVEELSSSVLNGVSALAGAGARVDGFARAVERLLQQSESSSEAMTKRVEGSIGEFVRAIGSSQAAVCERERATAAAVSTAVEKAWATAAAKVDAASASLGAEAAKACEQLRAASGAFAAAHEDAIARFGASVTRVGTQMASTLDERTRGLAHAAAQQFEALDQRLRAARDIELKLEESLRRMSEALSSNAVAASDFSAAARQMAGAVASAASGRQEEIKVLTDRIALALDAGAGRDGDNALNGKRRGRGWKRLFRG